jgi:chemotaxis protein CheX
MPEKRRTPVSLKAEFINPFLEGTVSVIKTMASVDPVPGKPYVKKDNSAVGDISGIVGITGEAEGSLCITFSKSCILHIIGKMFGEEQNDITDEVKDAVGELTNMISGDSRRRLQEMGHSFEGAIPTVVSGPGHEVRHISKEPILSIPFTTVAGSFIVEVCFR